MHRAYLTGGVLVLAVVDSKIHLNAGSPVGVRYTCRFGVQIGQFGFQ